MLSKYSCSICKTEPDQLSHHNAHLKTHKHKDNCCTFIRNMKIFSHSFRQVSLSKWNESSEAKYIIEKYNEYNKNNEDVNNDIDCVKIKNWIIQQSQVEDYTYDCWNDKYDKIFKGCSNDEYYTLTGIRIPPGCNFETANENLIEYINYSNWAIDRITKSKETICTKPKTNINKITNSRFKYMLSKHTNVSLNLLNSVRNGDIDLYQLTEPINEFLSIDMLSLYEPAVKYACLLLYDTGLWHLCMIYDGFDLLDITESPEEKYNQTFYFHKQVEIEHTSSIKDVANYGNTHVEKKNIWVYCDMIRYCDMYVYHEQTKPYNYLSDDDFKCIVKDRLCKIYQKKLDSQNYIWSDEEEEIFENKKKHYSKELAFIRELLLNSKLLIDIVKICEYLFEFNEELINHYKNNKPEIYKALEKRNKKLDEQVEVYWKERTNVNDEINNEINEINEINEMK